MQGYVFPDWWEDELAAVDANRALAEAYIYRALGFSMEELRDPAAPLSSVPTVVGRFKSHKNQVDERTLVSASVAIRAARIVVREVDSKIHQFSGDRTAHEIRAMLLQDGAVPNLDSLLRFCWDSGILVVPIKKDIPSSGKGFYGMADWVENRPVIFLASDRDGEPWLAFHLAHELGHIMLGHVQPDTDPWIDPDVEEIGAGPQEKEADQFAIEILTGQSQIQLVDRKVSAEKLAETARSEGLIYKIDPGVYCLVYAKSNSRWGVAENALKILGLAEGGHFRVAYYLDYFLDQEELLESEERLLGVLRMR